MSLTFRWLGVAGLELKADEQILAIDPFFSRPSLAGFIKPVIPDSALIKEKLPRCDLVLVTHSHWDHLMDVPEVLRLTGASAFGSPNTCRLLRLSDVPDSLVHEIHVGDRFTAGAFTVEVIRGQHSWIPFSGMFNGNLKNGLKPPLRLQDYRMDICLGYCISVMDVRLLVCAAESHPAEVLFAVAQEARPYYLRLFSEAQPKVFIPIHWDNFMRPLSKPLLRFTRPGRLALEQLSKLAESVLPNVRVIIPEIFKEYLI